MYSVCQIDRLISDALRYQTVSQRGKQEIQSFNGFLSDTNYSLKVCAVIKYSMILKHLDIKVCAFLNLNQFLYFTVAFLFFCKQQWSSRLKKALETGPENTENVSKHNPGTCSDSVAKGDGKLICSSSNLPDTDPVASPCSNFTEADMTVSPSPLVSWRTGACMVDSGKQLFLLTPLPKTKACSSRCNIKNSNGDSF